MTEPIEKDLFYRVSTEQITLWFKGESVVIKKDDIRYDEIRQQLKDKKMNFIIKTFFIFDWLLEFNLSIKNGQFRYEEEELSIELSNFIYMLKLSGKGILPFLYMIKSLKQGGLDKKNTLLILDFLRKTNSTSSKIIFHKNKILINSNKMFMQPSIEETINKQNIKFCFISDYTVFSKTPKELCFKYFNESSKYLESIVYDFIILSQRQNIPLHIINSYENNQKIKLINHILKENDNNVSKIFNEILLLSKLFSNKNQILQFIIGEDRDFLLKNYDISYEELINKIESVSSTYCEIINNQEITTALKIKLIKNNDIDQIFKDLLPNSLMRFESAKLGLSYEIVNSFKLLQEYSLKLDLCVGRNTLYIGKIINKKSLIIGAYKDGKLIYCIDFGLKHKQIDQIKAYSNSIVPSELTKDIEKDIIKFIT